MLNDEIFSIKRKVRQCPLDGDKYRVDYNKLYDLLTPKEIERIVSGDFPRAEYSLKRLIVDIQKIHIERMFIS